MDFADRLRELMEVSGLTQAQFAEEMGCAPGTLSSYLTRRNSPRLDDVLKYSSRLNVSVGWLAGEDCVDTSKLFKEGTTLGNICESLLRIVSLPISDGFFCDIDSEKRNCFIVTHNSEIISYFDEFKQFDDLITEKRLSIDEVILLLRQRRPWLYDSECCYIEKEN